MAWHSCPICGKRFDPEQTLARPFCSHQCRSIDLGRWLSEQYTVPEAREEPQEDPGDGTPPESAEGADSEKGS